jgi:Bacterial capsule synthesis protein PGA_cap
MKGGRLVVLALVFEVGGSSQAARAQGVDSTAAPSAGTSRAVTPAPGCITLLGDVMLARGVAHEIGRRKTNPWAELASSRGLARSWVGNFEGAVSAFPEVACPRRDGLCLGVEPQTLEWLKQSPFRALSIANNHIDDFGAAGHAATRTALVAMGVTPIDEAAGPTLVSFEGTSWAFVSLNLAGRSADERQTALERARLQIGLARAQSARVVVLPHWGREGQSFPAPEQELWAPLLARWGATLIVGSHAHVIQPQRCLPDVATYFGLGNHLFDQAAAPNREGLAVTCCPDDAGFRCATTRTARSATSVYPTIAEADTEPSTTTPMCSVHADPPDTRWRAHPARDTLLFVQPFPAAGPGTFFALRRHRSAFDGEDALRPYVFRVQSEGPSAAARIVDVWRGTALARPLVAARLFDWRGAQVLCAIHREDTFLEPKPKTMKRVRLVYRWSGFGFKGIDDEEAMQRCEEL